MKVKLQRDESIEIEYTPRLRAADAFADRMAAKYPHLIATPPATRPAPGAVGGRAEKGEAAK